MAKSALAQAKELFDKLQQGATQSIGRFTQPAKQIINNLPGVSYNMVSPVPQKPNPIQQKLQDAGNFVSQGMGRVQQTIQNLPALAQRDWLQGGIVNNNPLIPQSLKDPLSTAVRLGPAPFISGFSKGVTAPIRNISLPEKIGDIAGMVGQVAHPFQSMIGGAINVPLNAGISALQGRQSNPIEDYQQGFDFSAKLVSLEKLTSPLTGPILNKLLPAQTLIQGISRAALKGGIPMAALGSTQPAKNDEERLKNTLSNFLLGAIMSGAFSIPKEVKLAQLRVAQNTLSHLSPQEISKKVDIFNRDEAGRLLGGTNNVKYIKDPNITDAERVAFRKAFGLPEDGNYAKGEINFGAKVGGNKAQGAQGSLYDISNKSKQLLNNEGVAYTPEQASYVMKDGTMIAQSSAGQHAKIVQKIGFKGAEPEASYMKQTGDMRIKATPNEINISYYQKPTPEQLAIIEKSAQGRKIIFDDYTSGKAVSGEGLPNVAQLPLSDMSRLPDVLDIKRDPTGWKSRKIVNAQGTELGTQLVNPQTGATKDFMFPDTKSGTDLMRTKMQVQSFAIDNPIAPKPIGGKGIENIVTKPLYNQPPTTKAGGDIQPLTQKNPLDTIMERYAKKLQAEASGNQMLDIMAARKISPQDAANQFWSNTFDQLPKVTQDKAIKLLEDHTGMKLGYKGTTIQDMVKNIDLGNDIYYLQGTDRGFTTIMQYANDKVKPQLQPPAFSGGEIGKGGVKVPTVNATADIQNRNLPQQGKTTTPTTQTVLPKSNKPLSSPPSIPPGSRPKPEDVAKTLPTRVENFLNKTLGYSTQEPVGGTKQANIWTKTLRKGQEAVSTRVEAGMGSENRLVRTAATTLQNFFRGIGMSPERSKASMQLRGEIGVANERAFNVIDSLYKSLKNDKGSLERINAVLDPELAKTKVNYNQLTTNEKQVYDIIREGLDIVHDTSYANGHISTDLYVKNKGKYTPRLYEVMELPPEVNQFVNQGKKIVNSLYKARTEVNDWKLENSLNDPVYALGKRLSQVETNAAIKRYTNFLSSNPNYVSNVEKPGFIQLSDSPAYGALKGKYVLNSAAEDLKGFFFSSQALNNLYDVFRAYDRMGVRQLQKKLLTVFNPTTNVGNIVSDQVFGFMTGVDPLTLNKNLLDFKSNPTKYKQISDYLMKKGIIGTDITRTDFINKMGSINSLAENFGVKKTGVKGVISKLSTGANKVQSFYGGTDDVYKASGFKALLDKGYSLEEATRRVSEGFQNYANVGKFYDIWSKTPIVGSAFIKFQGDLIRIIKNGVVNNPLHLMTFLGALWGVARLSSKMSGESEQDRITRENRFAAPMIPGLNIPLTWQTPWGEINAARYISPFYANNETTSVAKMFPFMPNIQPKKDVASNIAMNANDPLLSTPVQLLVNRDFRGKPISDPSENKYLPSTLTPLEKATNQAIFAGRQYTPPLINSAIDVKSAAEGKPNMYGSKQTIPQAAARMAGIKISQFGPQEAEQSRQKDIEFQGYENDSIYKQINSVYKQEINGEITSDQATKRVENLKTRMKGFKSVPTLYPKAAFIKSYIEDKKTPQEKQQAISELTQKGYLTPAIAQIVKQLNVLDKQGLSKIDVELMPLETQYKATKIVARLKEMTKENARKKIALYKRFGIVTTEVQQEIVRLLQIEAKK